MGMGIPGAGGGQAEPQGPGKPEFVAVDDSIVFVLKPNELERKKRKFKSDGQGKLQVLTSFDGGLTGFTTKDGKSSSLRTTELLEHNQHVMLPEAAKKIRYLRSTFKRQMETEGKAMAPADRAKAVEQHLRAVFTTAAQEGGMHMSSFGPALESQMDMIPLREGVNDLLGALAYRGIPINVVCTGYGNVAIEVLRRGAPSIAGPNGALSPHLHMIANFFQSDETMSIVDLYDKVPLVHEGNKNGNMILDFHRAVRWDTMALAARSNAVVVGAELADLNLTAGLTLDDRITVGFLKMEEDFLDKFPRYAQAFDVVVVGNGDLSYVNELLYEVTDP
ncbi:pyrimidine 5'-nucleotidase-domain-containing protein [Tribonema minus]|uniref:5'-nucleotidase n=1 Tax=Tribonema minus TaxID=303371 RepID=A0A836CLU8_9STRA|nr:pyrimidine 5'-nucleotidase-domain-containing protein [Tribonema minus]